MDIALGGPSEPSKSVNKFAEPLTAMMSEAYESVRKHLGRAAARNKEFYDYGVKTAEYKQQERVWYCFPRCGKCYSPKWNRCYSGPFDAVRRINVTNYVIHNHLVPLLLLCMSTS